MTTIALLAPRHLVAKVFAERHLERLHTLGTLLDGRFDTSAAEVIDGLTEAEVIVSTWGMPTLDAAMLAALPRLRGVFYAAGTVKGIVTPDMYARDIVISSAAPANAVPVAEYTIGVILLSNKRFWSMMGHGYEAKREVPGNYRRSVGLIGASLVGREVLRLLAGYAFEVLLYDPFVSADEAAALGARKAELDEVMTADVVSLHAPNLPHLRHMLGAAQFAQMQDGATFINTARGALVDETALITELERGRIYAVLDVTDPEPPVDGSPLWTLPNVIFTPHIAGSMDEECHRMADYEIDELERFLQGQPLINAITESALARLA